MPSAVVRITEVNPIGGSLLRCTYEAVGSWGAQITAGVTGDLAESLGRLGVAIKDAVIAWAAADAVTLRRNQIIIPFADDQVSGVRKDGDQAIVSAAFVDVAGLAFLLAPTSHYKFKFKGAYTAAAGTTGLQLSINGPANPVFMAAVGVIYTSTGTPFVGAIGAYDAAIAATASAGATPLPFEVEGTISTGAAAGLLTLRGRTEIAASAVTLLRGSFGELVTV